MDDLDKIMEQAEQRVGRLGSVDHWQPCATCGARTMAVRLLADGSQVPICGSCILRAMGEEPEAGGPSDTSE